MTRPEDTTFMETSAGEEQDELSRQEARKRAWLIGLTIMIVAIMVLTVIYGLSLGFIDPDDRYFQRTH